MKCVLIARFNLAYLEIFSTRGIKKLFLNPSPTRDLNFICFCNIKRSSNSLLHSLARHLTWCEQAAILSIESDEMHTLSRKFNRLSCLQLQKDLTAQWGVFYLVDCIIYCGRKFNFLKGTSSWIYSFGLSYTSRIEFLSSGCLLFLQKTGNTY